MNNKIAFAALLLILILVNWSIAKKEKHLSEGQIVYLNLAPVDPRSLMQGDYMALRFRLSRVVSDTLNQSADSSDEEKDKEIEPSDGHVVVSLDKQNIASFKAIYNGQAIADNEILMRYRVRNGKVKFATNAFFFQEGHGKHYQSAQFGQFRVDDDGELLLTAMYDSDMQKLVASKD